MNKGDRKKERMNKGDRKKERMNKGGRKEERMNKGDRKKERINYRMNYILLRTRVSSRIFLHENRAKIAQRFSYLSSKHCTKFRCFCALMRKSYFPQILKKIMIFAYFVISCFLVISSYFGISFFQHMFIINHFITFKQHFNNV